MQGCNVYSSLHKARHGTDRWRDGWMKESTDAWMRACMHGPKAQCLCADPNPAQGGPGSFGTDGSALQWLTLASTMSSASLIPSEDLCRKEINSLPIRLSKPQKLPQPWENMALHTPPPHPQGDPLSPLIERESNCGFVLRACLTRGDVPEALSLLMQPLLHVAYAPLQPGSVGLGLFDIIATILLILSQQAFKIGIIEYKKQEYCGLSHSSGHLLWTLEMKGQVSVCSKLKFNNYKHYYCSCF